MTPSAHLVHRAPGRIRIRVPSRRHDGEYFKTLSENLKSVSGASHVVTNALTGSILILHTAELALDVLANYAFKEGLFELAPNEQENAPVLVTETISDILKTVDQKLIKWSEGQVDLRSAAFVGLFGLGLYQMARGRVLPAAISLFDDARGALRA
jgi:hypothetical protein